MNYQQLFFEINKELATIENNGQLTSYIPELANVDPRKFGVCLTLLDNQTYTLGNYEEKFSVQSIAKVIALVVAYELENEKLWERVGVEPSGTPFNSLVQLENDLGIPRNPFINAGALVVCDVLISHLKNPAKDFIAFVRKLSGNPSINYNSSVAASEKSSGYRNIALINFIKSFGNIKNDTDVVLDFYFNLCSIEMSCQELSKTFLFLANSGIDPTTNEQILSASKSKRINAIMQLCGFYDEAGEFSFKVGLPGKSGVAGGIIAIHPNQYSIAVWSPLLNNKGNSFMGMTFLEMFTTKTSSSIF